MFILALAGNVFATPVVRLAETGASAQFRSDDVSTVYFHQIDIVFKDFFNIEEL